MTYGPTPTVSIAILNSTVLGAVTGPRTLQIPAAGNYNAEIHIYCYTALGVMDEPDAAPTISIKTGAGAAWKAVTDAAMTKVVDGHYKYGMTIASTDVEDIVQAIISVTETAVTRKHGASIELVKFSTNLSGLITTMGSAVGASISADIANIHTDVGTADGKIDTINGHVTADYTATEKSAIDLLDDAVGGLLDIHTDIGTAITAIGDVHATDLPAVKTETALIVADTAELQTDWVDGGRLDLLVDSIISGQTGGVAAINRLAGKAQIFATTIDLHQIVGAYDLATATTQACLIESLVFSPRLDVSDDATITTIAIATDDTTPQILVTAVQGAKANLTAYAHIPWTGAALLRTGSKIRLTIAGGEADTNPTTCDVVIKFRAIVNGGYLA